MTVPQFRRWLEEKIAWLQDYPSEERIEEDREYAKDFIDEAYGYAVALKLPEAAAACRPGPVTVRLLECLNAIPGQEADTFTVEEVAQKLGVSKGAIYERCRDGRMPCTRIGNRIVITPEQLADYQRGNQQQESLAGLRHLS